MAISDNLKRGTIELTILTLLQDGDMYGYEISQQLSDRAAVFTVFWKVRYTRRFIAWLKRG